MNRTNLITWTLGAIFWIPVVFFSLLLAHNAMLYFTHGGEYGILPEKTVARQDVFWNAAFYIHLPAGTVCLLSPLFLFARRLFRAAQRSHAPVGRVYVWITLAVVCPTGMYLALYAKGGLVTQVGFMLQAILLGWFTWKGYLGMRGKNIALHVQYMIRSYSVAAVVLTFRILHILFFFLHVPYQHNYAISQWLGMSANMLIAEVVILFMSTRKTVPVATRSPISS